MGRIVINENRESKNINLARRLCISYGKTPEAAQWIIDAVRHDIPNSKLFQSKFLAGVTRMYLDGQISDGDTALKLNKCLKFLNVHVDDYDYNLNGMSAQDFIKRFSTVAQQDLASDMERSNNAQYTENTSYRIVRINDEYEAEPYGEYTDWCVTDPDSGAYSQYTGGGLGLFYFCLKDGFENVPMEQGENCPLDEYGLSMIAVSVNEDGSCNTITCRWNHDNKGNDQIMTVEQLEQLIGRKFYQTFKPRTHEEIQARRMEILDNMERQAYWDSCNCGINDNYYFTPLFDEDDCDENTIRLYSYSTNDYYGPGGEARFIIVDENADLVIDDFFDYVVDINGAILVQRNGKEALLSQKSVYRKELTYISEEWYQKIIPACAANGYFIVMNDEKLFNVISIYGNGELFETWYRSITMYQPGRISRGRAIAIVQNNEGFNIINVNGNVVGDQMFSSWRSDIAMGPGGIFIEATQEGSSSPLVNGKPMELYALNFDKFPYTVTQLWGWERGLYKIECGDRIVYIDDDTRNGWKIISEKNNNPSGGEDTRIVAENMKPKVKNIVITESMADAIQDMLSPTPLKFSSFTKKFLADLLVDPVNTDVHMFFKKNGVDKIKLINTLIGNKILKKKLTIDDHDADGNPHPAKMIVRFTRIGDGKSEYGVPKKRLDDKLEAAYRELFPDAVDEKAAVNEDGAAGGGAASCSGVDGNGFGSGEFVQPLFGEPIRRNGGKKKTAKGTTGGNPYTESSVMEAIDRSLSQVLRESRQMLSETEHPGMETDESAAAYIYASDKNAKWHILAARRASGDEVGKWNPPMGHRTKGESFMKCAIRECMEESGFDISGYASMTKLAGTFDWGREYAVVIPSEVGTIETLPKPGNGDGENGEFIWVPINKIGSLDWAWDCDKHAIANFRNHVKHG